LKVAVFSPASEVYEVECFKNVEASIKKASITDLDPNCNLSSNNMLIARERSNDFHQRRKKRSRKAKSRIWLSFRKFVLLVKITWLVVDQVKFTLLSRKKGREYLSAWEKRCLFGETLLKFVPDFPHAMLWYMNKTF